MADDPPKKRRRLRILGEETVRRGDADGPENPYWTEWEDQPPHPAPEKGCIRRGLCCKSSPGWFGPGEVEAAAALSEMTPDAFVRRYLIIDGIEVDGDWVEVFVPVKLDRDGEPLAQPGTRVDDLYRMLRSPCIFFDGSGCQIYGARPTECEGYVCTNDPEDNPSHKDIARRWRDG